MKFKIVIIVILAFFVTEARSQNEVLYKSLRNALVVNTAIKRFEILGSPRSDTVLTELTSRNDEETLLTGWVVIDNSNITCINGSYKDTIKLKVIEEYKLRVLNKNRFFKRGEILYAETVYNDAGIIIQSMNWEKGKRHGIWYFFAKDGDKQIYYEKGIIQKTINLPHR